MGLSPGARLGAFEILSLAGSGGMGEVYKARDTRLDRTVAIKILPPHLAADPQFRERFDREARVVSQLDHPNVCQLHDVGEHDGTAFLVMQYLEGETLAARLERGALPLPEALAIAAEIGAALDTAHRAGIVHRDLKPGNIFLARAASGARGRAQAKLLDFGLAKGAAPIAPGAGVSTLPTTPAVTQAGTVLGTFQYMSPEQIEGQEADVRSDIFAFGLVLYEMLVGRPAFTGRTPASLMGAILKDAPVRASQVQPALPEGIDHVLERCLAKEPDVRWQSVRDVVAELQWATERVSAPPAAARSRLPRWWWLVATAMAPSLVFIAAWNIPARRSGSAAAPIIRFQAPSPFTTGAGGLALSPDGKAMAFQGFDSNGVRQLLIRTLDSNEIRAIPAAREPAQLAWSPDSRSIAFATTGGQLRVLDRAAGTIRTLINVPSPRSGLAWGQLGHIVLGTPEGGGGLYVVEPGASVTRRIVRQADVGHMSPTFADRGRLIVYVELQQENRRVCVVDLNGQQKGCLAVEAETTAAYSESGHLIFSRGATVVAQRFDPERVVLTGAPVVLAEQVVADALGQGSQFAVTGDPPVFSYFSGSSLRMSQFAWFDRGGARLANVGNSTTYGGFDLSVDGRYLVTRQLGQGGSLVIDIERDVATQVSAEGGGRADVVWAPNADRFARLVTGRDEIVEQPAFGGVSRSIVVRSDVRIGGLEQWSRDGRYLIILVQDGAKRRVEAQPTDGGKPIPLVEGTALIDEPRMSPDGKWVTYNSDVTGTNEVYVMPFPPTGQSIRVSTAGGLQGRWRGDSAEIFYLAPDSTLMATSFAPGNPPRIGTPAQLFKTGIIPTYNLDHFDVTANGKRFLIKVPPPGGEPSLLNVVVNWTSALPEK